MYVTKGVLQRYVCFLGVRMFLLGIWVPPSYAQITSQITNFFYVFLRVFCTSIWLHQLPRGGLLWPAGFAVNVPPTKWWRSVGPIYASAIYHFVVAAKHVALVQVSSASCERVFSQVTVMCETCGVIHLSWHWQHLSWSESTGTTSNGLLSCVLVTTIYFKWCAMFPINHIMLLLIISTLKTLLKA
jgi:hypothetical protein